MKFNFTPQVKLNRGEGCLSTALPYDVAGLVKAFCRELPQPLVPCELQRALLGAQALPGAPERTSALQLLSCLLPVRNAALLHFLFSFLYQVSQRWGWENTAGGWVWVGVSVGVCVCVCVCVWGCGCCVPRPL